MLLQSKTLFFFPPNLRIPFSQISRYFIHFQETSYLDTKGRIVGAEQNILHNALIISNIILGSNPGSSTPKTAPKPGAVFCLEEETGLKEEIKLTVAQLFVALRPVPKNQKSDS